MWLMAKPSEARCRGERRRETDQQAQEGALCQAARIPASGQEPRLQGHTAPLTLLSRGKERRAGGQGNGRLRAPGQAGPGLL